MRQRGLFVFLRLRVIAAILLGVIAIPGLTAQAAAAAAKAPNTAAAPAKAPTQSGTATVQQPAQQKPATALDHLKQGDKYLQAQDYANAIEAYKKGLALNPDSLNGANASNQLGFAHWNLKQYAQAVTAFQQAIRFKSDSPLFHFNLGINLSELRQYKNAAPAFREAMRLQPNYPEAGYRLGVANFNLQQYPEAVEAFQQAFRQKPGDVTKFPDAAEILQQAVRLKPNDALAHHDLGLAYRFLKQPENAVAPLREALRLKPDYPEASNQLGQTYSDLKRFPDALAAFQQAVRVKPDYAPAYYNLGHTYLALGKQDDAMKTCTTLQGIDKTLGQLLCESVTVRAKAEQGDADAQNKLGFRLENGSPAFPQDNAAAIKWYTLAGEQGFGAAQNNLCTMHGRAADYLRGVTPPKWQPLGPIEPVKGSKADVDGMLKWCRKAAEQNFWQAKFTLGVLYAKGGPGLPPNYEEAYFWLSKGTKSAFVDKVGEHLTSAQRAEIQKKALQRTPTKTPQTPQP